MQLLDFQYALLNGAKSDEVRRLILKNENSMKDFNYYAPTEVVFGKTSEEQVAEDMENIYRRAR